MLGPLYYAVLRAAGVAALARRRNAGVILCYHNVVRERHNGGDPAVHLALSRFAAQMRWLVRHYHVVPLREIADRLTHGRPLHGVAAVTFDDAYQGVFEHAWPLLLELGIPATAFVVSGAPGRRDPYWWDYPALAGAATPEQRNRWLTDFAGAQDAIMATTTVAADVLPPSHHPADWETIAAAAESGLGIGVHSATHRTLPLLPDDELEEEIVGSWATIRRETGAAPEFFAYPYGRWDARVRDTVRVAGFRGALTLDAGVNGPGADPWALRRVNVPAGIPDAAFQAWCAGLQPRRSAA